MLKGQRQIRRDGAWVRREQTRGSWDPSAHLREAPTNRYSGYQQPFPSSAGSQSAHAMLLGRKSQQLPRNERAGSPEWRHSIRACSGQNIRGWWTPSQKQGNKKPGAEGQSGRVWPPYAGRTAIANRIQPPTSEGIHLVPNLGQPVTQTAIRGRRGGARTGRRCGGVDPHELHGRSRHVSKHPIMETYRDRASSQVETQIYAHTNLVTRSRTFSGS